ncbi:MAG: IS66 family insertion sequence element accessory protein TnpB [Exilibacterium sp.]
MLPIPSPEHAPFLSLAVLLFLTWGLPCSVIAPLFVFINKARTMIRVLVYDHNGYWIMTKRLSRVSFQGWPTNRQPLSTLAAGALMRLLRGDNGDHTPEKEPVNPIAQNVEKFRTESTKLPTRSTPFTRELNNVC